MRKNKDNISIIDTTWPINSRTNRITNTLKKDYATTVISWDRRTERAQHEENELNTEILRTPLGYGKKIKKLIHLYKFISHIKRTLEKNNPSIIIASHWDSLLCASIALIGKQKKPIIIYDCLDIPTSNNIFIYKFLRALEKTLLGNVSLTIFASRFFKKIYPDNIKSIIYENYPSRQLLHANQKNKTIKINDSNKKIISWVGVVRYDEVFENIFIAIRDEDYLFYIFGDGPSLENIKKLAASLNLNKKVFFHGRYTQEDLPSIYNSSDLIWAAYPTKEPNTKLAISNKYFECSLLNKTPIISSNTEMAKNLKEKNVVIVNEYDPIDIKYQINLHFEKNKTFSKYEPDIFWEDEEDRLINAISNIQKE